MCFPFFLIHYYFNTLSDCLLEFVVRLVFNCVRMYLVSNQQLLLETHDIRTKSLLFKMSVL